MITLHTASNQGQKYTLNVGCIIPTAFINSIVQDCVNIVLPVQLSHSFPTHTVHDYHHFEI